MINSISWGFSGGLFLSVGLIHMLPEASEVFDSYFAERDQKILGQN